MNKKHCKHDEVMFQYYFNNHFKYGQSKIYQLKQRSSQWIKKKSLTTLSTKNHLQYKNSNRLEVKKWKRFILLILIKRKLK